MLRSPELRISLLAVLLTGGLWLYERWSDLDKPGTLNHDVAFPVIPGTSLRGIRNSLVRVGAIDNPLAFRLMARLDQAASSLRAGHYLIKAGASAREILELLKSGQTILQRLTIPEGLTSRQILTRLAEADDLSGPLPPRLPEASLMPETYMFARGTSRLALIEIMTLQWHQAIKPLWEARPLDYPLDTLDDALILASIVEKEAVKPGEMPVIAQVFLNRLQRNMRLQSDPTVIYALSDGLGKINRRLYRKDWKFAHDHNTYHRKGLPPTAISHPSLKAVAATLNPTPHGYLYFVADGNGGHRFATSLDEHNRNVALLRKARRKKS